MKWKILTVIMACILMAVSFLACGKPNNGDGGKNPPVNEMPKYDDNGNLYIDLTEEDELGNITYNGMNKFIAGYDNFPEFSDVHSSTPFAFTQDRKAEDVIGIVHAGGKYNFSSLPYLTEGAKIVREEIGSRIIKLFLGSDIADQYAFNEEWGNATSLVELIRQPEIKQTFNMDFSTIVLCVYEYERAKWNTASEISVTDLNRVENEFYDLTKELLKAYNATGKTFVLQNWEGDNELTPALKAAKANEKEIIISNYIAYNNARQQGIVRAREELSNAGSIIDINVLGALEVNYISYNGGGQSKLVDVVVPYSKADIFSFSDWSSSNTVLAEDLDYYLSQINLYRNDNEKKTIGDIVLGEFGRAEYYSSIGSEVNQFEYSIETAKIAINKGVRYVCYWALMCNERVGGQTARPVNQDMKGYWLIKPNGELTKTFWYLKGLFENKNFLSVQPKVIMRLPKPQEDPIPFVESDILFFDNFDDKGVNGVDISRNRKMQAYSNGMVYDYVKEKDQPLLSRYFTKYSLTGDIGYYTVQKTHNNPNEEYIQYAVVRASNDAEAKFVIQGFIYDPTPKSMIKVMATKNGTDYETLKSVYFVDKTAEYGYLYVTTKIAVGYQSVRVVFCNVKSANSWDPLVCRIAFLR